MFSRLFEDDVSAEIPSSYDAVHRQLVEKMLLILSAFNIILTYIFYLRTKITGTHFHFFAGMTPLTMVWLCTIFRKRLSERVIINVPLIAYYLASISGLASMGLAIGAHTVLLMVCLLYIALRGKKIGFVWSSICVVTLIIFWVLTRFGSVHPPANASQYLKTNIAWAYTVVLFIICVALGLGVIGGLRQAAISSMGSLMNRTRELETALDDLEQAEEDKRIFYRETISSVTSGKLIMATPEEIRELQESADIQLDVFDADDIPKARNAVTKYLESKGLNKKDLGIFITSFGEAINNAIKHAGKGKALAGTRNGSVWAGVADNGPGISTLTLPKATLHKGFSTRVSMGMGFTIMLNVADTIMLCTGPEGTTVLLFKDLVSSKANESIDDLPDIWDAVP